MEISELLSLLAGFVVGGTLVGMIGARLFEEHRKPIPVKIKKKCCGRSCHDSKD